MASEQLIVLCCISVFLLLNLAVGLWAGRKVDNNSLLDYALAKRSMGTGALTITFIATMISAPYLGSKVADCWEYGALIHVCQPISFFLSSFVLAWYVFPKLVHFQGCYTLGDIIERMYGEGARVLTGIISAVFSILMITAQLIMLGHLYTYIGLPAGSEQYIMIGMGAVLVFYTWFGGIRSVTMTDILQFILIISGFTIIVNVSLAKVSTMTTGGVPGLFKKVAQLDNQLLGRGHHFIRMLLSCFYLILYPTVFLSPPMIQRVLMTQHKRQLKQVFMSVASFYAVFRGIILLTGFCLLVTTQNTKLEIVHVTKAMLNHIFEGSMLGQLLLVMMALGITMSTADSYLNAVSISIVRDVLQPVAKRYEKEIHEMRWIRYTSAFVGVGCTLLAILSRMGIPASFFSFAFFSLGSIVFPFIVGLWGLKVNEKSFYSCIITYFLVGSVLVLLAYFDYLGIGTTVLMLRKLFYIFPIILLCAILAFVGSLYATIGGVIWEKRTEKELSNWRLERMKRKTWFWQAPVEWAREKVASYGSQPTFLAFFFCVWYMFPNITSHVTPDGYNALLSVVSLYGLVLCLGLLLHRLWPLSWKPYFDLYWFYVLFYCIPFSNTLLFLHNSEDRITFVQMALAILLLIVLVDWYTFLWMGVSGVFLATGVHIWLVPDELQFAGLQSFDMLWSVFFGLGATMLIGLIFASKKELLSTNRISRAKLLASAFGHDLRNALWKLRFPEMVKLCKGMTSIQNEQGEKGFFVKEAAYKELKSLAMEGEKELGICRNDIRMFEDLVKHDQIAREHTVVMDIERILKDSVAKVRPQYRKKVFVEGTEPLFDVELYPNLFHHVISNLVKNAFWHGAATRVSITWDSSKSTVYITDDGRGIPAEVQPRIFDLFYTTNGNGIGLPFVRMVVESAGGRISLLKTSEKGTTFAIVFPKK